MGRFGESGRALRRAFANPDLRRVQLAWAASLVGGWAYSVALAVFAYRAGGATAVGIVGIIRYVPSALVSPFAALLADRYARRYVMFAANALRAAAMAAAALAAFADAPAAAVYACAAVIAISGAAFRPAQAAVLPSLARAPEELTAANVAASTIESVGVFVGPALGGLLLAATSEGTVFVATAVALAWAALLVVGLGEPERERPPVDEGRAGRMAEAGAGFRALAVEPGLRLLAFLTAAQTFVFGALTVLVVVLALDVLDTGPAGVGFLNAALGVGGVVGTVGAFALVGRTRLAASFGLGNVFWGLPLVAAGLWPEAAGVLVLFAVIGAANTIADVAGTTLLQRAVSDAVLARVFGALETLIVASIGLGALAAPALVAAFGSRGALVAVGAVLPVLVAVSWPRLVEIDRTAAAPGEELGLLRSIPMFAPLSGSTLEQLASSLVPVRVEAGTEIMRRGDPGDRFYVVAEGAVEVAADGRAPERVGPGGYFGEIALIRDVPRTATVVAAEPTALWALEREEFIAAVTGHPESAQAADAVVGARLGTLRAATD